MPFGRRGVKRKRTYTGSQSLFSQGSQSSQSSGFSQGRRLRTSQISRSLTRFQRSSQLVVPITQHYYSQHEYSQTGSTPTFFAKAIRLDLLPSTQVTSLSAIFDQYRIREVRFTIIPRSNNNNLQTQLSFGWLEPSIHTVIDYDDDTVPTSLDALVEYDTYKATRGTATHVRVLKPRPAVPVYSGPASTAYAMPTWAPWINCADPDVPHYGIKGVFLPFTTNVTETGSLVYDLKIDYILEFRAIR